MHVVAPWMVAVGGNQLCEQNLCFGRPIKRTAQ
jgi:hypothetical protein